MREWCPADSTCRPGWALPERGSGTCCWKSTAPCAAHSTTASHRLRKLQFYDGRHGRVPQSRDGAKFRRQAVRCAVDVVLRAVQVQDSATGKRTGRLLLLRILQNRNQQQTTHSKCCRLPMDVGMDPDKPTFTSAIRLQIPEGFRPCTYTTSLY